MDIESHPRQLNRATTNVNRTVPPQIAQVHGHPPQLAIALRNISGNCILIVAPVQQLDNGEEAWTHVRDLVRAESNAHRLESWMENLVTRKFVGTVSVRQIVPCETTSSNLRFRISLYKYKHDTLFTEAFQNPSLLSRQRDHISGNENFTVQHPTVGHLSGRYVIVISTVLDKVKVTGLLILLLFILLGVVGLQSHRAGWGIAICTTISIAFVSLILNFIAWMLS